MEKKCTKCGISKPVSEFHKSNWKKDGLQSQCKICRRSSGRKTYLKYREKRLRYARERQKSNPERHRDIRLRCKYPGMTVKRYEKMLEAQDGVCLLCKKPKIKNRLCIDHSHKTGEIRGLLCNYCNFLVGCVENYPILIQKIFGYLEKGV